MVNKKNQMSETTTTTKNYSLNIGDETCIILEDLLWEIIEDLAHFDRVENRRCSVAKVRIFVWMGLGYGASAVCLSYIIFIK